MSHHTDPTQAKSRPVNMRQDYYGGNWYEDPDPPTYHQDPKPKYGLLLVLLACIAFWASVGIGTYIIFF